ncbi:MAG TPA: hypothetical protein VFY71_16865 [Planctomycetota bacterium]|nr:hypothetical protein [Planctomycetota bacterium]
MLGCITYRFASDEHKELFVADPWKYEPRKSWLDDEAALLKKADGAWTKLGSEQNRGDAARAEAVKAPAGG